MQSSAYTWYNEIVPGTEAASYKLQQSIYSFPKCQTGVYRTKSTYRRNRIIVATVIYRR